MSTKEWTGAAAANGHASHGRKSLRPGGHSPNRMIAVVPFLVFPPDALEETMRP